MVSSQCFERILVCASVIAVAVTGCASGADLDKVMGRSVEGMPQPAPEPEQRIDCDLIFPGGTDRR